MSCISSSFELKRKDPIQIFSFFLVPGFYSNMLPSAGETLVQINLRELPLSNIDFIRKGTG